MNKHYYITDGTYLIGKGVGSYDHLILKKNEKVVEGEPKNLPYRVPEKVSQVLTYVDNRKKEYPSIGAQLDMLFHAMKNGEIPVATEWFNTIKQVKDKYPKEINNG